MNRITIIFLVLFIVSCSSGNKDEKKDNTRVLMENTTDSHGIQRMQESTFMETIEHKGKSYKIAIQRTPDDNLPMVKSEVGDMFVDNKITLIIIQGGKDIFNKTFTKADFFSLVGKQYQSKSILEGMVYDQETPQGIQFAVSISYPQTDLFFPITLTISESGKMSMKKEEISEEFFYE